MLPAIDAVCLAAVVTSLFVSSSRDLSDRTIPNGCSAVVALSGIVWSASHGLLARSLAGVVAVLALMVLVAAIFAAVRGEPGVGGGDVKLLSAVAAWVGPVGGLLVVGASCLLGVAGWFVAVASRGPASRLGTEARGMPLAPAITIAALLAALPMIAGVQ